MSKAMFMRRPARELGTIRSPAVMVRPGDWRIPLTVERCLLIVAGPFRLAQLRMDIAVVAMAPAFIRYRPGVVSWRGWHRTRLWRMKRRFPQGRG
jgi:hypothetical protein